MKAVRHILVTALLTLFAFGTVLYTSCKNKCGNTTCQNGGTCDNNKCVCPVGYSGNACQAGWSNAIIGTYTCSRANCVPGITGVNSWQSAIIKDPTNSGYTIEISNFDNSNITVVAILDSGINGIQNIVISPAVGSYGVNATGTFIIDSNIVKLDHFTTSSIGGVGGYTCSMTMTKLQ